MSRPTRMLLAVASALSLLVACGAGPDTDPVPLPDLEGVDLDITRAVQEARERVLREPESSQAWGALGDRLAEQQWSDVSSVDGLCRRKPAASNFRKCRRKVDACDWNVANGVWLDLTSPTHTGGNPDSGFKQ